MLCCIIWSCSLRFLGLYTRKLISGNIADNLSGRHYKQHVHAEATHLVGLMRGLLPKRNDGRSSETVPFRRRKCSVRSNPGDGLIKGQVSKGQCLYIQAAWLTAPNPPVSSRGWSKVLEKRCSSTPRAGQEPPAEKEGLQKHRFIFIPK